MLQLCEQLIYMMTSLSYCDNVNNKIFYKILVIVLQLGQKGVYLYIGFHTVVDSVWGVTRPALKHEPFLS